MDNDVCRVVSTSLLESVESPSHLIKITIHILWMCHTVKAVLALCRRRAGAIADWAAGGLGGGCDWRIGRDGRAFPKGDGGVVEVAST